MSLSVSPLVVVVVVVVAHPDVNRRDDLRTRCCLVVVVVVVVVVAACCCCCTTMTDLLAARTACIYFQDIGLTLSVRETVRYETTSPGRPVGEAVLLSAFPPYEGPSILLLLP